MTFSDSLVELANILKLTQTYVLFCFISLCRYGLIPELTLDVFYPFFPWNEEHNEIFELSFHLPKKLLNKVIKKILFDERKSPQKSTFFIRCDVGTKVRRYKTINGEKILRRSLGRHTEE